MKAALLPDRGVIKVAGEAARGFLNGIVTSDIGDVAPGTARFAALLTPQGKIIVDFLITEAAAEDGGGFYFDVPKALAPTLAQKLNFYKLRAKVTIEDLSDRLGVMAVWDGAGTSDYGLTYPDPRFAPLGFRVILPPEVIAEAAADLSANLTDADAYEAHRIALGVPRGGADFVFGDTFPHEADMDQLGGVDFDKGCYIGQEVVSRVEHRSTARSRVVPVAYDDNAPMPGLDITAGDKPAGMMGSAANGRGLALLRLDRVADAIATGTPILCGGVTLRVVKPDWARFAFPGETKAAE
ncbi:folate-binding protein YgfZ [Pseudolabrys sp. FHR47]|uniref:CAF17-like 4Fe-4S cluster assembly/insertion protein YgfZ n=1 Tax=Pseudolabrys sp. FHR47 TaxID=2562284 RepID=UPI0010BE55C7|nr:folate-binding protein YgfZ [Pseudolabrys sp. FHR47]